MQADPANGGGWYKWNDLNSSSNGAPMTHEYPFLDSRKMYEFHPLANKYPLLDGQDSQDLLVGIQEAKCIREPIWLFEDKILDGRNRYLRGKEAHVRIPYRLFDPAVHGDPELFVKNMNEDRRHESHDVRRQRRAERIENIKQARKAGKSIRQIAEEEGVSPTQIDRDLKSATVPPGTVGPDNGKVIGRDGIERPSTTTVPYVTHKKKELNEREPGQDDDVADAKDSEKDEKKRERSKRKPPSKDSIGNVIPDHLLDLFGDTVLTDCLADLITIESHIATVHQRLNATVQHYPFVHAKDALNALADLEVSAHLVRESIKPGIPLVVCPKCKGDCKKCKICRFSGYLPQWRFDELVQEEKDGR